MKKLGYGVAILVAVLIAAVLIVPSLIDWNAYKPEIAAEIKKATGRDVSLRGDLSFAVLPQPHLSIADARLSNAPDATAPQMVSLRELNVSVKLAPLLSGLVEIASVELVEPVIELEKLKDGRGNWEFAPQTGPAGDAGAAPGGGTETASGTSGGNGTFRLDRLQIDNGTLVYRDAAAGTVERIEKITVDASAGSINGPFELRGTLSLRGIPLSIQANVGRIAEKGTIPVTAEIRSVQAGAGVTLKGTVTDAETAPRVSASVEAGGADLASAIASLSGRGAPASLSKPFSISSSVEADGSKIDLNRLKLALGETRFDGDAEIRLGDRTRIDLSLKTGLFDANQFATAKPSGAAAPAPGGPGSGAAKTESGPAAAATAAAGGGALPADIDANVSISASEIAWKDGRARDAILAANLKNGVLTVETLSAKLPGGGEVAISGSARGTDALSYSARVELGSPNLRATLAWLEADVSAVAADRLRRLDFKANVSGNAEQVQLTGIDGRVDTTRIGGGVTVALRERPAFGASVSIDQLDIDSYLPPNGGAAAGDEPQPEKGAGASAAAPPAPAQDDAGGPLAALETFDANMVVQVARLTFRRNDIRGIRFDGTLQNGKLTIRDASVRNLAGTSAQVKGTLNGFRGIPAFKGSVAAASDNLAGLFQVAGIDPPVPPARLGKMRLSANTDISGERLSADATLQLAEIRASLKGSAGGFPAAPEFDVKMGVKHPNFVQMVRMFDPGYTPRNTALGDFALSADVKGGLTDVALENIDGHVGGTTLSGTGSAKLAAPRPQLDLNLTSGVIPVSDFLPVQRRAETGPRRVQVAANGPAGTAANGPAGTAAAGSGAQRWSREKFDTTALGLVDANIDLGAKALLYDNLRVDDPKVVAVLKDKVLDVKKIAGTMFDGGFDMTGQLDARAVPKATTSVTVTQANVRKLLFDAAELDLANGILNYKMDLTAQGASQYDLIRALNGNGRIDVTNGAIRGFDLRKASDGLKDLSKPAGLLGVLNSAMGSGTTQFSKLDGTFRVEKGVVRTEDVKLIADAGAGNAAGYVDLPAWNMDVLSEFRLTEHPKAPPFRVRLTGPPDQPKRIFDFQSLQSWVLQQGAGRLLEKLIPKDRQQDPSSGEKKEVKPEDVLKGLLKGLGR